MTTINKQNLYPAIQQMYKHRAVCKRQLGFGQVRQISCLSAYQCMLRIFSRILYTKSTLWNDLSSIVELQTSQAVSYTKVVCMPGLGMVIADYTSLQSLLSVHGTAVSLIRCNYSLRCCCLRLSSQATRAEINVSYRLTQQKYRFLQSYAHSVPVFTIATSCRNSFIAARLQARLQIALHILVQQFRPPVCRSDSSIVSKRVKISLKLFHCVVAHQYSVLRIKRGNAEDLPTSPLSEALNTGEAQKIHDFRSISLCFSETKQDKATVLNINRTSCVLHQIISAAATLLMNNIVKITEYIA